MNFDTSSRVPIFAVPHVPLSDNAPTIANEKFAYSMRAVANVQAWRSYLPSDCVNTMIEMGWDRSTVSKGSHFHLQAARSRGGLLHSVAAGNPDLTYRVIRDAFL